ncbi:hypothetical protein [Siminovitchia sp. 179-K 8D1 HS]|uniref:hypothetical protein n=1 Tax=Siminovitchia sp. 179-K 8D1 HS TaxID=3142385 RepID=UPI0039A36D31
MSTKKYWTKEDDATRNVAMPNEMISDLKKWREEGLLKSPLHQEFAYSYYWLVAYLWRYAKYAEFEVSQKTLKKMLGYSENEKRINYIISRNGLLDKMGYTESVKDFPVGWSFANGSKLDFEMWSKLDKEFQKDLFHFRTNRYLVKKPLKSMGINNVKGLFWEPVKAHMVSGEVFKKCMNNKNLSCAGFYLYGIFTYMSDVNINLFDQIAFRCSNKSLMELTGWSEDRLIRVTNELRDQNVIKKWQPYKGKGYVNNYEIIL